MRFSIVYIAAFTIPALEVAASKCWAPVAGISASYGPLKDLRTDATLFCNIFSSDNSAIVSNGGKYVFGFQSAIFTGTFANSASCLNTFNQLVTDCYGAGPTVPATIGGTIVDAGGANLAISFGTGAQF
ncbi:hypothetical protein CVT26_012031 [Gymnopilus dilepis]|uniref:Uncharacterized protein n=1 Tax=Gymnopilus dilepis TaxID=231916 RepID=A0A409WP11_9AGAR|nr:hypothetical protein CVT26_012031 [Gymnopilus dilepis]